MGFPSGSLGTRNHGSEWQLHVGRALPAIACGAKVGGARVPAHLTFYDSRRPHLAIAVDTLALVSGLQPEYQ